MSYLDTGMTSGSQNPHYTVCGTGDYDKLEF